MPADVAIFLEIGQCVKVIKPSNASDNEIDKITKNNAIYTILWVTHLVFCIEKRRYCG